MPTSTNAVKPTHGAIGFSGISLDLSPGIMSFEHICSWRHINITLSKNCSKVQTKLIQKSMLSLGNWLPLDET